MSEQRTTQDPTAPVDSRSAAETTSTKSTDRLTDEQSPAEAIADLKTRLAELSEYQSYLISAKLDGIKSAVRYAGVYAAIGLIGAIAGAALVVTAVVLLCRGIANGLGVLFGGRFWLGDLVTAVLLLGLLAGGTLILMSRLTKASRERTERKYASRQQQQRSRFGTDVGQRAERPGK